MRICLVVWGKPASQKVTPDLLIAVNRLGSRGSCRPKVAWPNTERNLTSLTVENLGHLAWVFPHQIPVTTKKGKNMFSKVRIAAALAFVVALGSFANTPKAVAHHDACCTPAPVCCPPPPVKVPLCIVDPCTGCTYKECVCVPACCAGETPCCTWRKGLFGRKILTYTWKSCCHSVDVTITRRGKVKVND